METISIVKALGLILFGFQLGKWYIKCQKPKEPEIIGRRGLIFQKSLTNTNKGVQKSYDVDVEIEEIESTSTKTKIKVLNIIFNDTEFIPQKDSVTLLMNNSWVDTSDIEWIEDIQGQRDKKINEILK